MRLHFGVLAVLTLAFHGSDAEKTSGEPNFPVTPEIFIDTFKGSEGITFNREGRLFIGANNAVWVAEPDGTIRRIAAVHRHLGQAGIGSRVVAGRTGEGGIDGLVTDERGRIYIADNGAGKIRRYDPSTREMILIAEGMTAVASLVFGEGKFDRTAIYATSTARGGGRIWKVPVGVGGAPLHR
jgi:sugar lactone lactonase YvrE